MRRIDGMIDKLRGARLLPYNLALAALSFFLPAAALALNDTDGLVREGLFPLAGGGTSLEIVSEVVSVTLARESHLSTVRTYTLKNSGKAGMYRLGALCSRWTDPCENISIDGVEIRFSNRTGRLAAREDHVEVQKISRAEIENCEVHNDGDICGHVWAEFPIWFDAGGTRAVSIRFKTPLPENYFFEAALERLNLYTEKFWKKNASADFEIRFAIEGARLSKDLFKPLPDTPHDIMNVSAVDKGAVLWRLRDFDAGSDISMVHPYGIDLCALYQVYRKAGGRYPEWPKDKPVTPCSRRRA